MGIEAIVCPNCGTPLSDVLTAQIAQQAKAESQAEIGKREQEIRQLKQERDEIANSVEDAKRSAREQERQKQEKKLQEVLKEAQERAKAEARDAAGMEIADLQKTLKEGKERVSALQNNELALREKNRKLEQQSRDAEIELARRVDSAVDLAKQEVSEAYVLKNAEKEVQLSSLRRQIEELKRKAEQGSQQVQGEVLELHLEEHLSEAFDDDEIVPVPKGEHGGDNLQHVRTRGGQECGTILWEAKRTKNWSEGWVKKLKADQRSAKADVAVIVSTVLPEGVAHFTCIDNVWVTSPNCAIPLAAVLRTGLLNVAAAHRAEGGKSEKMEVLYQYLSGTEFKHRIEAIIEAFSSMKEGLEQEKRAFQKAWAQREKQLDQVIVATAGMHGDLSAIIGQELPKIAGLEMKALGAGRD